jgi:MFS transporter, ACS family, solute carrier family 17 (sodium-dependent inorganic phosphate cotransporter), other
MASIQYAGTFVGMVIAMSTCGVIAQKFGWEMVFYIYGVLGCIWYVLWFWLVYESPETDPHISEEEKKYIMQSLNHQTSSSSNSKSIPFKSIFTSSAVWAIAASHFAENWGVYTMLTQLPLFLKCKTRI